MSIFEIGVLLAIFVLLKRLRSLNIVFDDKPLSKLLKRQSEILDPFTGAGGADHTASRKLARHHRARNRTK